MVSAVIVLLSFSQNRFKVRAYINGMGIISPQHTWGDSAFLSAPVAPDLDQLTCIEPQYEQWIAPQQLRRMSRILKMGTAAASIAMNDAKVKKPDGIITGTGYGCLEDTATFLGKITDLKEEALNPTPFMQSTHNTIGSQIALLMGCQGYNQTYTQNAFSFEQSLLDSMIQLRAHPDWNILAGAADELTKTSHAIHRRFDKYRQSFPGETILSPLLYPQKGTLAGEGAAYFLLSAKSCATTKASLEGVRMHYRPEENRIIKNTEDFLHSHDVSSNDIDVFITGRSGDHASHKIFNDIIEPLFSQSTIAGFKHLCGEHCSASAFAFWMGAMMLHHGHVPEASIIKNRERAIKNILIYNVHLQNYHTLILLKSCRDTAS